MIMKGLTIVIPALNEGATIAAVVSKCLTVAEKVLVVDDGSRDQTGPISIASGATVLRHEKPEGYDAAVSDGINRAFELGASAVVTCDADGQHRVQDVRRVSEPVLAGEADFSAGIRDSYNRTIEAVTGLIAWKLLDTKDPFCGLKCYSKSFYQLLGGIPREMNIGTLPLAWAKQKNLRTKFIPISVDARLDEPRFGATMKASYKLAKAFSRTLGFLIFRKS